MAQPPNLNPFVRSSVGPPGACMMPSRETWAADDDCPYGSLSLSSWLTRSGHPSTANGCLDCGDVDLFHRHHRIEHALCGSAFGTGVRFRQDDRRNLPVQSPFVLPPAALALFAAVSDNRVPVTIGFGLISGCDLKRERFVVLERASAI